MDNLQYLITNLRKFGNTTIKGNPEKYIKQLEAEGLNVTFHPSKLFTGDYIVEVTGINKSNKKNTID